MPASRPKPRRLPNALGRGQQKNVPILLEEKIGRAQSQKQRRTFFCGAREQSERRRGGSALVRMFVKVGSDFNQKVPQFIQIQVLGGGCLAATPLGRRAKRAKG